MKAFITFAASAFAVAASSAIAAPTFTAASGSVLDEKAVFATVESREIEPARVRTGGTILRLSVKEGDHVVQGQTLAEVADQKLELQRQSIEAQISGLQAQLAQAQTDLDRAQTLIKSGAESKAQLDQLTTAASVAATNLKARIADHDVVVQQLAEGSVLAPTTGRVLKVPVTAGSYVMSGETIALVAEQNFVLRLQIPETYAHVVKSGDPVRVDGEDLVQGAAAFGSIALVYPQIQSGDVVADANVVGLGDYFVGERIRVWISAGLRTAIVIPAHFLETRYGLDYALVRQPDGSTIEVPVQRGISRPQPDMPDALEILSGLKSGDVLVQP